MEDSYGAGRRDPAIMAGPRSDEPGLGEFFVEEPDGTRWLDVVGDEPAMRLPCGGRCECFGVQGCHSPRCRVGEE